MATTESQLTPQNTLGPSQHFSMRCKYTETLTSIKRSPRVFFTSQKNAHVFRLLTKPSADFSTHLPASQSTVVRR